MTAKKANVNNEFLYVLAGSISHTVPHFLLIKYIMRNIIRKI